MPTLHTGEQRIPSPPKRIRFDRNELAGAFGDIGTDLPLIVGMILASGLDPPSVLIAYGLLQIFTAFTYGIPMPVEPLKAVAALVIAQNLPANLIYGAGLSIGLLMLVLTVTGSLDWLARIIPKAVVRGIQFGLGLQLSLLALTRYVPADGATGYVLAAVAFAVTVSLLGNRKYPPALIVVALGLVYAFIFRIDPGIFRSGIGIRLPLLHLPVADDLLNGFLLLALPQVALSIGNSILATQRIAEDYFPEKGISVRKIGFTYSLMNLAAPFASGIPVCHGSGGMVGHYIFGARTGGSTFIYGSLFAILGLVFGNGFAGIVQGFPLPILGVILLFEGLSLIRMVDERVGSTAHQATAVLVGLMCAGLPYGYLVGLIVGSILVYTVERFRIGL